MQQGRNIKEEIEEDVYKVSSSSENSNSVVDVTGYEENIVVDEPIVKRPKKAWRPTRSAKSHSDQPSGYKCVNCSFQCDSKRGLSKHVCPDRVYYSIFVGVCFNVCYFQLWKHFIDVFNVPIRQNARMTCPNIC